MFNAKTGNLVIQDITEVPKNKVFVWIVTLFEC